MFCPKCGNPEQKPETYCRQCGIFLPDLEKSGKTPTPPERHLLINTVLSSMSIVVSLVLAFVLYSMNLGLPETRLIVYLAVGFLIAMSAWQIQMLWRTILLKKQLEKSKQRANPPAIDSVEREKKLEAAEFENVVPATVTERTTRELTAKKERSS